MNQGEVMNLSQEVHRDSVVNWNELLNRDEYFRLKVIEIKERRVSTRLCNLEYEMAALEQQIDQGEDSSPRQIYGSVLDTLNHKFQEIDDQILILENGSLDDEEILIERIERNLTSLEKKINVFSHFVAA